MEDYTKIVDYTSILPEITSFLPKTLLATCVMDIPNIEITDDEFNNIRTLSGHINLVHKLLFNHDSSLLVSLDRDEDTEAGNIKIWDTKTWECLDTLGEDDIMCFDISEDNKLIIGYDDDYVEIYDISSKTITKRLHALFGGNFYISLVKFFTNNIVIIHNYDSESYAIFYNLLTTQRVFIEHSYINDISISKDKRNIVLSSNDIDQENNVFIYDVNIEPLFIDLRCRGNFHNVFSNHFSEDGRRIILSGNHSTILIISLDCSIINNIELDVGNVFGWNAVNANFLNENEIIYYVNRTIYIRKIYGAIHGAIYDSNISDLAISKTKYPSIENYTEKELDELIYLNNLIEKTNDGSRKRRSRSRKRSRSKRRRSKSRKRRSRSKRRRSKI